MSVRPYRIDLANPPIPPGPFSKKNGEEGTNHFGQSRQSVYWTFARCVHMARRAVEFFLRAILRAAWMSIKSADFWEKSPSPVTSVSYYINGWKCR